MGIIKPFSGGSFRFSNAADDFTIASNKADGTLAFEYNAQGIPFTRTDSAFNGLYDETVDNAGAVELIQYEGWQETASADDLDSLDDTTAFDDLAGGEAVFDYIMSFTATVSESALMYFDGIGEYVSDPYHLGACRTLYSDVATVTKTLPVDTVLNLEIAVSVDGGSTYGQWQAFNDGASVGLNNGDILEDVWVKYKFKLSTTDETATPSISQWDHTLNSYIAMRIDPNGDVKYAGADTGNYSEVI
jgi:hypothetical protein